MLGGDSGQIAAVDRTLWPEIDVGPRLLGASHRIGTSARVYLVATGVFASSSVSNLKSICRRASSFARASRLFKIFRF
jgi:hypothetical protein